MNNQSLVIGLLRSLACRYAVMVNTPWGIADTMYYFFTRRAAQRTVYRLNIENYDAYFVYDRKTREIVNS